jgi:hypothetical protein
LGTKDKLNSEYLVLWSYILYQLSTFSISFTQVVKRYQRPVTKPERKLIELTLLTKMEKTPESVAAEIAALRHTLSEATAAIDKYAEIATQNVGNKDSTASGEVSESHRALFLKTSKLLTMVRGPVDMVISNFENVGIPSNDSPWTGKID